MPSTATANTKILWNDAYLRAFTKELLNPACEHQFWQINSADDEVEDFKNTHIRKMLMKFYPALGVANLVLGNDETGLPSSTLVFVRGNRVMELDIETLRTITYKIFNMLGNLGDELRGQLHNHRSKVFDKQAVRTIPDLYEKTPFVDTADAAYRFFQNGWIKITKEGVSPLLSYEDVPENKIIWNSSVIARDYDEPSSIELKQPDTHFRDFVTNLAKDNDGEVDDDALKRLELSIGYLCHRHHIQSERKYVLLVDKFYEGAPKGQSNGGNGKSLLINTLGKVMNLTELDGRAFKKSDKNDMAAFAQVTPATEICHIDDAVKGFPADLLFTRTTGDFHVRRLYKNPFSIPAKSAPKIAVTSNFPLEGEGNSYRRREFIIEVGNFYRVLFENYDETPYDIHGHKHIGSNEWNKVDWIEFYRYIFECISKYITNGLPVGGESDYYKRAKAIALVGSEELVDYLLFKLNEYCEHSKEVFAEVFYKEVRIAFPEQTEDVYNATLWNWLGAVGKAFKMYPNKHKNGSLDKQRLTDERWHRWIAEGMANWKDKNNHSPEKGEGRVSVFKVSTWKKPETMFSAPDFATPDVVEPETPINKNRIKKNTSKTDVVDTPFNIETFATEAPEVKG